MRLLARVLHSSGIVQNCYAEPAWGSRWINTNLLSGIQCAVVNCSTDNPALYPWNTDSYANSVNFLVALGTDSNNFSVYSVGGTKNIICIKEFDGYTNTPRLYIADNKIYVNLKDHKISYQVLIVRFGKLLE